MATLTATRTSRKPARKPERSATLGTTTSGKTILWLSQDGVLRAYVLTPLPSEIGGAAYRLGKADNGDGHAEEYDVLLHGRETSCTCPGHTYRGKCKHVEALEALTAAGKLAAAKPEAKPQPAPKPEATQPWCEYCNDDPNAFCHRCSL